MTTNTISKELEIQIVQEWWYKLNYIVRSDHCGLYQDQTLSIYDENTTGWFDEDCVEIVVNEYERTKKEEDIQHKQNLLDKKAKLMAELAEINEELGE